MERNKREGISSSPVIGSDGNVSFFSFSFTNTRIIICSLLYARPSAVRPAIAALRERVGKKRYKEKKRNRVALILHCSIL